MKTLYTNLDIHFTLDNIPIHALNIIFERFSRTIPSHSHGSNCYEVHYIPCGFGKLKANEQYYNITPNTLYITGPHITHAQTPVPDDPMQEYCIYFKLHPTSHFHTSSPILSLFTSTPFWIGTDTQGIHILMKQLFYELEHRCIGYQNQVCLLLSQLLICIIRNYEQCRPSSTIFASNNLSDAKSIIIEEYFLYEYHTLSLNALAEKLKLSPRQTQRLLMEYYGKTFQQKKAEALLLLRKP